MLVLKILGVIAAIIALFVAVGFFDAHCEKKFNHKFFTVLSFILAAVAAALFAIGLAWYNSATASPDGDILNGIILLILACVITVGIVVYNIKRTNILYGIGGSAFQFGIFVLLAHIGVFVMILGAVCGIVLAMVVKPVWVINK